MDLDLRDLRYFQTIAELSNLGRAAEQLCRSQPALTKCIRRLESALGAELFERKGRGIQLTPVGEMLLSQTRSLLNAAGTTLREVQEYARGEAGSVRLGCGPITAEYLLPRICALVLAEANSIRLEITVGMNYALREQLNRGEIDLIAGMVQQPDDEFITHPLGEDIVVVAAGRTHPIFAKRTPTMQDMLQYEWVLPISKVASRRWLDRAFEAQGLPPPRAQIEANSIPMLPQMIARTELLCFASRHILSKRPNAPLKEVPLEATTMRRQLGLTYPKPFRAPAIKRFVDLLCTRPDWVASED